MPACVPLAQDDEAPATAVAFLVSVSSARSRRVAVPVVGCVVVDVGHAPFGTLTPRELEIFRLVAQGMSNSEIGAALFIAETTVKTHLTRVLVKLGLRDRIQAVVLAYESGIVSPGATPG